MNTARDLTIYLEEENKLPDGTPQLALHNLQQADVDIIRSALAAKRTSNVALLSAEFGLCNQTTERLRAELHRIDTINLFMHLRR